MDYWQSDKTSLLSRTSFIFNKELLSDVRFIVGSTETEYPAHKFLLSLASPVFEQRFSEYETENVIKVPDIVPSAFHKMLQYVYTDTLVLDDQSDASNVLEAAKKYKISHLQIQCENFICSREIPPEKVCKMHDVAINLQMSDTLKCCQHTFVKKTKQVLQSDGFLEASLRTVEAIVQNEELSADEITIIKRIIEWGIAECKRKGMPETKSDIRHCINPLMQYLRFLSLSLEDIRDLLSTYDIFESDELFSITMKLSQPGVVISVPASICQNVSKRNKKSEVLIVPKEVSCTLEQDVSSVEVKKPEGIGATNYAVKDDIPPLHSNTVNTVYGAYFNHFTHKNLNITRNYLSPTVDVRKTVKSSNRENPPPLPEHVYFKYNIPLHANGEMTTGFKMDDVCSILRLRVRNGRIRVRGLLIKLKDIMNESKLDLQIIVRMSFNNKTAVEEVFVEKPSAEITLLFGETTLMQPSDKLQIEVTIEGLQPQRCLVCDTHNFLSDAFAITLLSNQRMIKNQMLFLVGQIFYSTS